MMPFKLSTFHQLGFRYSSRLSSRIPKKTRNRIPIVHQQQQPSGVFEDTAPLLQPSHPSEYKADIFKSVSLSPSFVLKNRDPCASLLSQPLLIIGRQVELMNVFIGVEQQNKYTIRDSSGAQFGWIIEEDKGFVGVVLRQLLRTRREFKADVMDMNGNVVLKVHRPIKWLLNSTITVSKPNGTEVGIVQSDWHLWRRRYDLFLQNEQIARIDDGFWAWDFHIEDQDKRLLSFVTRKFIGFVKELFTDMGQYVVHFDSICQRRSGGLSLDERSVILAAAISIDIDYFSRHSQFGSHMGVFHSTSSD
jgi:uncharacterized protein YxjI